MGIARSFLLLALVASALQARAATVAFSAEKSQVVFEAVGKPAFLKIKGEGARPTGHLAKTGPGLQGELRIPLNDLGTGIALRDEHMKEKYLETGKYPEAVLKLESVKSSAPNLDGDAVGTFEGALTLHGQTKPVTGPFEKKGSTVKASFSIKLSDFAIGVPKYAGITVAEDVKIEATLADVRMKE